MQLTRLPIFNNNIGKLHVPWIPSHWPSQTSVLAATVSINDDVQRHPQTKHLHYSPVRKEIIRGATFNWLQTRSAAPTADWSWALRPRILHPLSDRRVSAFQDRTLVAVTEHCLLGIRKTQHFVAVGGVNWGSCEADFCRAGYALLVMIVGGWLSFRLLAITQESGFTVGRG